jgi:nucleotide-binding universal stress UspA family protein
MVHRPYVSLKSISTDRTLVCQLPRGLAYYYLALPLAADEDGISVAMAHPEDRTALGVLESVLGQRIVPVQGDADELRAALDTTWEDSPVFDSPGILFWGKSGTRPHLGDLMATILASPITWLDADQNNLATALEVARAGRYRLTVVEAGGVDHQLSCLLRESATPILIAPDEPMTLRRILLVLRGHSPDESALEWIIPLARATSATVTLLAVAPPFPLPFHTRETRMLQGLPVLLSPDSMVGEHIFECAKKLNEAGLRGTLRLRQGHPDCQIADEIAQEDYDLIVIAAEANGLFVQRVLQEVESRPLPRSHHVLVIKPAAT